MTETQAVLKRLQEGRRVFGYKGYVGSLEVSLADSCLYGKLMEIEPLVSYEGETVEELRQAFKQAVDEHIKEL